MKGLSKKYSKYIAVLVTVAAAMLSFAVISLAADDACVHANTVIVEGKDGSCSESGYTDGVYCNDCGAFVSGHIETGKKHAEIPFKRIEPTCCSIGYTEGVYCHLCETFLSGHEEIPFAEHQGEERSGEEPSCDKVGYTDGVYCTVCESWISGHEEIPASHKEVYVPKVPETCTVNGYTEGIYCTECEEYVSGREVIPASHKEVYVPEEPATCTGNGYTAGRYCTVCNEFFWGHVEIPFIDHDFTEKIIDERHLVRPATVESPAVYRYDCATCTAISPTLTFTDGERLPIAATSVLRAAQNTTAIRLTWAAVPGAVGYRVYSYIPKQGWKALIDVNDTTTTFTGLTSGTVYIFAVRAFTVDSGKVILSHDYTTIETATKTLAPSRIATNQNTSAIRLMWTPVRNATGYRIYFRTKAGEAWRVCVKSTVETSHTFTNLPAGKTYQFAVRPYMIMTAGFIFGEYSTYVASTVPAAPKAAVTSPAPKHVSLSWSAVSADGYQLYYRINNGAYKLYRVYTSPQKLMFSGLASGAKLTFAVRSVKRTSGGYLYSSYTPVSITVR